MTITVRQVRRGTVVRLTGPHARALDGALAKLLQRPEPAADMPATAPAPANVPTQTVREIAQ